MKPVYVIHAVFASVLLQAMYDLYPGGKPVTEVHVVPPLTDLNKLPPLEAQMTWLFAIFGVQN